MAHALEMEIDRNFVYFLHHITDFVGQHKGQFALLRDAAVVSFHDTLWSAEEKAAHNFSDGLFSIQEVNDDPVDLGFYTYAAHNGETEQPSRAD